MWEISFLVRFLQQGSSKSGGESTDSGSAVNTLSSRAEAQFEPESPISRKASNSSDQQAFDQKHLQLQQQQQQQLHQEMSNDISRTGASQNQSAVKASLEKVLNLLSLTVNLAVLSLSHIPKLWKKVVPYCYYYCFDLSLSLSPLSAYLHIKQHRSQQLSENQRSAGFPWFLNDFLKNVWHEEREGVLWTEKGKERIFTVVTTLFSLLYSDTLHSTPLTQTKNFMI